MSAVVALLWRQNERVLREFVPAAPAALYVGAGQAGSSRAFIRYAGYFGTRVELLDALVDERRRAELELRAAEHADELLERASWARLAHEHAALGFDADRLRSIVARRTAEALGYGMRAIAALEAADARDPIDLVVVNDDVLPRGKASAMWARARGIPVLQLGHGLYVSSHLKTSHGEMHSDAFTVPGKRGRPPFRAMLDDAHLPITGYPSWDGYPALLGRKAEVRATIRERYGLAADAPVVLFATTAPVSHRAFIDPSADRRTLDAMLAAHAELVRRRPETFLIVKGRLIGEADPVAAAAARHRIPAGSWTYCEQGLSDLIVAADVVVSCYSNVAFEAMLAEVPAIDIWTPMDWFLGPAFRPDDGILEATGPQLAAALVRVLDDPAVADGLRALMRARLPDIAGPNDGNAAKRVAGLMQQARGARAQRTRAPAAWSVLDPAVPARDEFTEELLGIVRDEPRTVLTLSADAETSGALIAERWPQARVVPYGTPLPAGSVDLVVLPEVLARVRDPWSLLVELRPLLAPGGRLVASIPNARMLSVVQGIVRGDVAYGTVGGPLDVRNLRYFTLAGIARLFAETEYAVARVVREFNPALDELKMDGIGDRVRLDTPAITFNALTRDDLDDLRTWRFMVVAHV
jgi:hypothetical protein